MAAKGQLAGLSLGIWSSLQALQLNAVQLEDSWRSPQHKSAGGSKRAGSHRPPGPDSTGPIRPDEYLRREPHAMPARPDALLRLDDGSLVGSAQVLLGSALTGAVVLTGEQAYLAGRLGEQEVSRVAALLSEARSRALQPVPAPVPEGGSVSPTQERAAPELLQVRPVAAAG